MKDSLDILMNDDYVEHHGVKGMHWGVRKQRYTGEALTNRLSSIEANRQQALSSNKTLRKFVKRYPSGVVGNTGNRIIISAKNKKYEKRKAVALGVASKIHQKHNAQLTKTLDRAIKSAPKDKLKEYKASKKNFEKMWNKYGHAVSERNQDTGSRFYLTKERRQKYNEAAKRFKESVKDITLSVMKDSKNESVRVALESKLNNEYWRKYI